MTATSFRSLGCAAVLSLLMALIGTSCGQTAEPSRQTPAAQPPASRAASDQAPAPLYPLDIGTPDPLVQRFCDALHALPEARKAQCCGGSAASSLVAECVRTLTSAVRDRAVVLDPRNVDRCVEAASTAYSGCNWVTPLAPPAPAACTGVVQGQLQSGAGCRSSLECADGLYCKGARPTVAGVCSTPGPVNALCSGAPDTLALYVKETNFQSEHPECDGFCRGSRCAALLGDGGMCSSNVQCGPGLRCDSGRCVDEPLPRIGEACTGNSCEPGGACLNGRCTALKQNGEACTSPFECLASCVVAPGATAGACGPQCVADTNAPPLVPRPTRP